MRKASDVIGLPVLSLETGAELGSVCDILCDQKWHVLGVLLDQPGWFQDGTFVPMDKVHVVGEDCLTVTGDNAITSLHTLAANDTIGFQTGISRLKGKAVFTQSGVNVGKVEDVYFTSNWEKLVGYELSNGWITDVREGRKRLPVPSSIVIGESNLIVPDFVRV